MKALKYLNDITKSVLVPALMIGIIIFLFARHIGEHTTNISIDSDTKNIKVYVNGSKAYSMEDNDVNAIDGESGMVIKKLNDNASVIIQFRTPSSNKILTEISSSDSETLNK